MLRRQGFLQHRPPSGICPSIGSCGTSTGVVSGSVTEPTAIKLVVGVPGGVRCIYDESFDLRALGKLQITRASRAEPDAVGFLWAEVGAAGGPARRPLRTARELLLGERAAS